MKQKLATLLFACSLVSGAATANAQVRTDYDHDANLPLSRRTHGSRFNLAIHFEIAGSSRISMRSSLQRGGPGSVLMARWPSAHFAVHNQPTLETFYDGFGGGWRWRGFGGTGLATTTTDNTKVGCVTVDLFDARTRKLIWRGRDSDDLSSN